MAILERRHSGLLHVIPLGTIPYRNCYLLTKYNKICWGNAYQTGGMLNWPGNQWKRPYGYLAYSYGKPSHKEKVYRRHNAYDRAWPTTTASTVCFGVIPIIERKLLEHRGSLLPYFSVSIDFMRTGSGQ